MTRIESCLVAAVLATGLPASAHMLGGGGRPAASASSSSDSSPSAKAWSKLDPPAADPNAAGDSTSPQQAAVAAEINAARARCDPLAPSSREACYRQAVAEAVASRNASAPTTKVEQLRAGEAARIQAERARCDAAAGPQQQACYEELSASHEKWHEKYDPEPDEDAPKTAQLGRAKCYKIRDAKKRRQCLKDLYKSKHLLRSTAP